MRISMVKTSMTRRINRMGETKLKYSEYIFEGLIGGLLLRIAGVYGLTKKDMVEAFREGLNDGSRSKLNE